MVLFNSDNNFDLSKIISFFSKSSEKFGKFSVGRQSKLKSELSVFKLNLFSFFKSKLISELDFLIVKTIMELQEWVS